MSVSAEFLSHVWPSNGFYCLALPKSGNGRNYYEHISYTTIEAAARAAENFGKSKDVYFAVGTLKQEKVWNPDTERWNYRTHDNMLAFRSLIMDIDVGEGKPYANQTEAMTALVSFTTETGLPRPTVVSSGGGLHVYYTLDQDIGADDWYQFAIRLKAIAKHFKLAIDNSRTSDKSSVLRVAGTFNYKKETAREVKVIHKGEPTNVKVMQEKLIGIIKFYNIPVTKPKVEKSELDKMFADVEGNVDNRPPANLELILKKCAQMAYIKEVGGVAGYQLRASAVSIIKRCSTEDYEWTIANDPNPQLVREQLETFLEPNCSLTSNPHTCDHIEEYRPEGCNGCQFKGKILSPVSLGYERRQESLPPPTKPIEVQPVPKVEKYVIELDESDAFCGSDEPNEQPTELEDRPQQPKSLYEPVVTLTTSSGIQMALPDPPFPYKRTKNGVFVNSESEDGERTFEECIYHYDIYPYELIDDTNEPVAKCIAFLSHGKIKKFDVPMEMLVDPKALSKLLARNMIVPVNQDQRNMLGSYMSAYINEIQRICKTTDNFPQLGWHEDGEKFVLPGKVLNSDGSVEEAGTSKAIRNATSSFRKRGTLEEWKKVIDVYARPGYEAYAFGHCVGYASILFRFTGYEGAMVNMVGDSGSGKSTVLQTINSIFGHPKESMLMQHDKPLAKINRLGIFNSICVTYDEITNIEPEELSDLCYSITQGRGRHRLDQTAQEKENNTKWQLLVASTSNANLMNKLSSLKYDASAESLRVFEYNINSMNVMDKAEARETFRALEDNFGHAGEVFVSYVVQHPKEVRNLVDKIMLKFDEVANVPVNERYWSSIVACVLAGCEVAKKVGLVKFDTQRLFDWSVNQILAMRGVVKENRRDPRGLLVEFMNSHINNTIVVGGGTDKDKVQFVREEPRANGLCIRNEIDRGLAYISKPVIRAWLAKGGSDYNWIKRTLQESKILVDDDCNKVLSSGSAMVRTGQSKCWLVNLSHPEMAGNVLLPVPGVKRDENVMELFEKKGVV
jgi:ABC-type cobalamin/Fe3+-siderophores transport system ATPase subunit